MAPQRPNIVYIHAHDTGRYIQPYGFPVSTPRLQGLAEQGTVFRQAFSAAPTCSPSRAALLTGETPHQAGMLGLAHRGFHLNHPDRHLASFLRDHGYETILTGMQHVEDGDQSTVGYTQDLRPSRFYVADVAPIAVDTIRQQADAGTPFFLDVGFEQTHRPFPEPAHDPRWVRPPVPLPDTAETREDMAAYLTSADQFDRGVGMVLDALEEQRIRDNTIIVCTTDHGLAFPDMKGTLTDHGIGVFLIISAPMRGFDGGTVVDAIVSHMDVYPTLCDLMSLDAPEWLQGESLVPLVSGSVDSVHDAVFGEVTFHATYQPMRSIRTSRWLYIRRFAGQDHPVLANVDDSLSRDYWLAYNWEDHTIEQEALYDLVFDPVQRNNVVDDPAHADTRAQLREKLESWMQVTSDPLLHGTVPLPEGARINRIGARSADEELVEHIE